MKHKIKLEFYHFKLPLIKPYKLSFTTLNELDTFIVKLNDGKNRGIGEVTALYGYSWETSKNIKEFISYCISEPDTISKLKEIVNSNIGKNPFAVTPILTAIEIFENSYKPASSFYVHLVGLLDGINELEIKKNIENLIIEGYKVFKVKIGRDIDNDCKKVRFIKKYIPNNYRIRLDANQAYNYDEAKLLISNISNDFVELLEQPFKPNAWAEMGKLNNISSVQLMLDESIWSKKDIDKAIKEKAADIVKLKLFKHCSPLRTLDIASYAQEKGLKVILGNGVQTELACSYEADIYNKISLDLPGEMNGCLKLKNKFSNIECRFAKGNLDFNYDTRIKINQKEPILIKKNEIEILP